MTAAEAGQTSPEFLGASLRKTCRKRKDRNSEPGCEEGTARLAGTEGKILTRHSPLSAPQPWLMSLWLKRRMPSTHLPPRRAFLLVLQHDSDLAQTLANLVGKLPEFLCPQVRAQLYQQADDSREF